MSTTAAEVTNGGRKRKAQTPVADERALYGTKRGKGKGRGGKGPGKIMDNDLANLEGFLRD